MKLSTSEIPLVITALKYALEKHIIDPRAGPKVLARLEASLAFRKKEKSKALLSRLDGL